VQRRVGVPIPLISEPLEISLGLEGLYESFIKLGSLGASSIPAFLTSRVGMSFPKGRRIVLEVS